MTLLYFIFIFASVKKFSLTLIISLVMSLDTYEGGQWLFGYKFSGLAINLRTTWCNHSFVIFYARSAPPPFCAHIACLYCPFFCACPVGGYVLKLSNFYEFEKNICKNSHFCPLFNFFYFLFLHDTNFLGDYCNKRIFLRLY